MRITSRFLLIAAFVAVSFVAYAQDTVWERLRIDDDVKCTMTYRAPNLNDKIMLGVGSSDGKEYGMEYSIEKVKSAGCELIDIQVSRVISYFVKEYKTDDDVEEALQNHWRLVKIRLIRASESLELMTMCENDSCTSKVVMGMDKSTYQTIINDALKNVKADGLKEESFETFKAINAKMVETLKEGLI